MNRFRKLFPKNRCAIIGMIHVGALPGTPAYAGSLDRILQNATQEAEIYKSYNLDSVLIENMFDTPYLRPKDLTPETISFMTRISTEIRKILPKEVPCGIQILAGCNKEAIAVAKAANLQYIRAEGFVFSHIADEGFTDACAGPLLRYRQQIDAEDILIFTDIKKKHSSHAITSDLSIAETVKAAEFFRADGAIVTGNSTGDPVDIKQLKEAAEVSKIPILIGSGVTLENYDNYTSISDGMIIGSHFKANGKWENPLDEDRVRDFTKMVNKKLCQSI